MNDFLVKLRDQVKQILNGFTTGQKAVTAVAIVGVLLGSYLFTSWASKPDFAPLFTGLESADAAAVTEALQSEGTPYKLANGGATIMVPANEVSAARLSLSGQGLPQTSTVGWGILDKQGITASEFQQRVGFQRALEGELDSTISAMDVVQDATVHLVVPKEDLFTDDQQKATASVLLKLRANKTLTASQVQAVVHLVASSVEGLSPDSVAISDTAGNVLSAPGDDGADLAAGDFRAQQTAAKELAITKKVKDFLSSVVGPTGADVRVAAELNFDSEEETSEEFGKADGTAAPVVSTVTNNETYTNTDTAPEGVLGGGETAADAQDSEYTKEAEQQLNAVDKKVTRRESAPGAVERLSVAVLLDQEKSDGVNLAALEDGIAAAAGINAQRGDTIEVSRVAFDDTIAEAQEEALKEAQSDERMDSLLGMLKSVGTVLLVAFGLMWGYRRMRGKPTEEVLSLEHLALRAGEDDLLELDEDDYVELEPHHATIQIEGEDPTTVLVQRRRHTELDRLPGLEERMAENADIVDLIDRQPEDVALLLRGWLAERR
jgi:flagellar M-ring protein FliF